MTVELLQTLSLASYVAAAVMLLLGVALFFLFDVPRLYGELSGRTAKKAIEAIRKQNASEGNKASKPSVVNAERGRVTDRISYSGKVIAATGGLNISVGTEKFATATLAPKQGNETTLLVEGAPETTLLVQPSNETTVLNINMSEQGKTEILHQDIVGAEKVAYDGAFRVEVEMSFTGSSEIIE